MSNKTTIFQFLTLLISNEKWQDCERLVATSESYNDDVPSANIAYVEWVAGRFCIIWMSESYNDDTPAALVSYVKWEVARRLCMILLSWDEWVM